MKRPWTIIGVADVPQSFQWYQSLLGLPEMAPAHDYFGKGARARQSAGRRTTRESEHRQHGVFAP